MKIENAATRNLEPLILINIVIIIMFGVEDKEKEKEKEKEGEGREKVEDRCSNHADDGQPFLVAQSWNGIKKQCPFVHCRQMDMYIHALRPHFKKGKCVLQCETRYTNAAKSPFKKTDRQTHTC